MNAMPFEWQIGWRYLRAGRGTRRNGFVSFISAVSVAGIALGVAALIVVLSVVNGFQVTVRERMLEVIAHVEVFETRAATPAWQALADELRAAAPAGLVTGVAPFVSAQLLLGRGEQMRGAVLHGLLPEAEVAVSPLAAREQTTLAALQPGSGALLLGATLARELGANVGASVTLVLPAVNGGSPRLLPLRLAGTLATGHHAYDSTLAWAHRDDVTSWLGAAAAYGVQLRLADADAAPALTAQLRNTVGPRTVVRDWTGVNRAWFASVQLQKRMLALILALIVAVAAFNLVATLVMAVNDKRGDIAILRTLGASPASVTAIFVVQGALAGIAGTAAGVALGLGIALNIDVLVPALERLLGTRFLAPDVYLLSSMPSLPRADDVTAIALVSLALALGATLYPSWRAARQRPADALRGE